MIKTMLAAILAEQNKPLVIDEVELPSKLDFGQVLVKIHYSGICGSQLGEIDGVKGADPYLPHLLGHEGSGTVMEIGLGVKHVIPGDKIVLHWQKGLGIESDPPSYNWKGKKLNAGWITSFNEYAIVSENRCTKIPRDSDLQVAVLFGCAVTTGFGVIENNAKVHMGESVVVFGAGGIGLNIIQAASLVSAYPIIAVDQYNNRLKMASEMGADYVINSEKIDIENAIVEIAGPDGVNVFIDNTGNTAIIELGYKLIERQGRVILVGVPKQGNDINIHSLPLHFGKKLIGSFGGNGNPNIDIPRYQKLFRNGRIRLREQITNYYKLDEINDAIQDIRDGKVSGRCLISMA
jgi:S-(hydroxymethyl)glutathione dehydrogenase/alcohol dehydrogenase